MRLFIAIELPEEVKNKLMQLKCEISGARWVPREQLHLTLSFLGELDEALLPLLTGALSEIHAGGFELSFGGIGCFPNARQARVLWVGLETEPLLDRLAHSVRTAVLACDIPQEERPFSAHITLARLRQPAGREVAEFLERSRKQITAPVQVREFILFRSSLTPKGAIHTPLRRFRLH